MLQFFTAANLVDTALSEGAPWDFAPSPEDLGRARALPKRPTPGQTTTRVGWLKKPETQWNIYFSVRGIVANSRISGSNPAFGIRGLVADYDVKTDLDFVRQQISQMQPDAAPNFIEISLGMRIRLVWVFERELLVVDSNHCKHVVEAIFKKLSVATLLAGFDSHSANPWEPWTNGGEWHVYKETPLAWDLIFGFAVEAAKKVEFGRSDVPIEVVAAEVEKRFPKRWRGDFAIDALGVRFWDSHADAEAGCQVKPDGMLCFTGTVNFLKWREIFGPEWVNEQTALNLGKIAGNTFYDGHWYYQEKAQVYVRRKLEDVIRTLKTKGVSAKIPRGRTSSEIDDVLEHIGQANWVDGAGPLVNYRPGLVILNGRRLLNTSAVRAMEPASKLNPIPSEDFPWLWSFLNGFFATPEARPLDHFLAWLQRFYRSQYLYDPSKGQAVFICGPVNNGKNLVSEGIIQPLVGKASNPDSYFKGGNFSSSLFEAPLLMVNDATPPSSEKEKQEFLHRLKSFVVNNEHTYHRKYGDECPIEYRGRFLATLNDNPDSIGLLVEVNSTTSDKVSFYRSVPYGAGVFPKEAEITAVLRKELPLFARYLLDTYTPPSDIVIGGRLEVKSYFDPYILRLSREQDPAYNFREILAFWCRIGPWWTSGNKTWQGTPTELLGQLTIHEELVSAMQGWRDNRRVAKALTSLAKTPEFGISRVEDSLERLFLVDADVLLKGGVK